jgi:hypothetical protein
MPSWVRGVGVPSTVTATCASYHLDGFVQPFVAGCTGLPEVLEAAEHVEMPFGEGGEPGAAADGDCSGAV